MPNTFFQGSEKFCRGASTFPRPLFTDLHLAARKIPIMQVFNVRRRRPYAYHQSLLSLEDLGIRWRFIWRACYMTMLHFREQWTNALL